MATEIQTIIFPKEYWKSANNVKEWLKKHDFKTELDETETSYRARQKDPSDFQENSFKTICLDETEDGCRISAVIGRKKLAKYFTKKVDFEKLGYEKIPDVELLKTGEIGDYNLSEEDLIKVINNFENLSSHGDYPTVFVGHDKVIEKPVIGFIGALKKSGDTLLGDLYIDKNKLSLLREYPKRSCELWVENDNITLDGVALLGSSPPRFNLGLLLYASKTCKCRNNSKLMGGETMEENLMKLEQLVLEIQQKLTELSARLEKVEHELLEPAKEPAQEPPKTEPDEGTGELVAQLKAELMAERKARQQLERRLVLDKLAQEYDLDLEEEIKATSDLNDDQFKRHIELVKKNYRKRASASRLPLLAALDQNDEDLEKRAHEIAFARGSEQAAKGIKVDYRKLYEQVLSELKGGK